MSFVQAINSCLRKYADFEGRASRPEFWWFVLFAALVSAALASLNVNTPAGTIYVGAALAGAWSVAILLPTLAVAVRRLRDAGRPWEELLWLLVPIAGLVIAGLRFCEPTQAGEPSEAQVSPPPA